MDKKILNYKKRRASRIMARADGADFSKVKHMDKGTEDYQWITVNGSHVPIDDAGNAVGGAGGALKGKNFSKAKKYASGDFSHIQKKGSAAGKAALNKSDVDKARKAISTENAQKSKRAADLLDSYEDAVKSHSDLAANLLRYNMRRFWGSKENVQKYADTYREKYADKFALVEQADKEAKSKARKEKAAAKASAKSTEKIGREVGSEVLEKGKKNWVQSKPEIGSKADKTKKEMQGVRHEQMIRSAQKSGDKAAIQSHVDRIDTEKKAGSGFRVGESVYVKNADGSYKTRKGSKGEWTHVSAKDAKSMISNEIANGAQFSYDRYDWKKSALPDVKSAQTLIKDSLGGNSGTTNCEEATRDQAPKSTLRTHTKDGKLTPEREELHQQIVANAFMLKDKDGNVVGEVKKPKGKPVYTFLGGGPAAGKSTITNKLKAEGKFPQDDEAVTINPDEYKEQLPEAKSWSEEGDSDWANNTHEESSAIAKRVGAAATANGYNIVNDACNDGGAQKMIKKIEAARASGMEVAGVYVTCPTEEALKRNEGRASSESSKGRLPLPSVVRSTHKGVSDIFEEIAPHFDHIELYDTMRKDSSGNPLLIASCKRGEKVTVHHEAAYKEFLDKAKE